MDVDELRRVLVPAGSDRTLPPGFADATLARGRGYRRRRRLGLATGTVGLLAVVLAVFLWPPFATRPGPVVLADPRFEHPSVGDLGGAHDLPSEALAVWREWFPTSWWILRQDWTEEIPGDPQVLWAGSTPGGTVAVIGQRVLVRGERSGTAEGQVTTLVGLVGPDAETGELRVLGEDLGHRIPGTQQITPSGFLFGEDDRTLLVTDPRPESELHVSTRRWWTEDARVERDWWELDVQGAVAVTELPEDVDSKAVQVATLDPEMMRDAFRTDGSLPVLGTLVLSHASDYPYDPDPLEGVPEEERTPNNFPELLGPASPPGLELRRKYFIGPADAVGGEPGDQWLRFIGDLSDWEAVDPFMVSGSGFGNWTVTLPLPGGRTATVGELDTDDDVELFTVVRGPDGVEEVVHHGPLLQETALPVRVPLPADAGWVVVAPDSTLGAVRTGTRPGPTPRRRPRCRRSSTPRPA
ncbi:hypothetical protein [Actinoalloteichus spitiensis]|uniref:hypothetical protein n=1 Tax=Actinoalloteichus spitiensis TaxID=252394 RepID=UPI00035DEFEC|nr:hypothetical protein [Actinoalloteichus spitiensis]